jgi:hypothetical protein
MTTGFFDTLAQKAAALGYHVNRGESLPEVFFGVVAKRQFFNWLRFGFIEADFLVAERAELDRAGVGQFAFDCFRYAVGQRQSIGRMGLPIHLFIFPVAVVPRVDPTVRDFIREEPPEQMTGAFQFPVIYEVESGAAHYFQKTPRWGLANYKLSRQLVTPLFGA